MTCKRVVLCTIVVFVAVVGLVGATMPFAFAQSYVNSQTNPIWSNTFSVPGYSQSGDAITCGVKSLQVQSGLVGTELFGTVSSNQPIDFWVMSLAEINAWSSWASKGSGVTVCSKASPPGSQVNARAITSYSMAWTVPDSQTYYFIFWNPGSTSTTVSFSYWTQ